MKILNAKFIDVINIILSFCQRKLSFITDNSFIIENIDKLIFFFICLVFISSLFLSSGILGLLALCTVGLIFIKTVLVKGQNIQLEECNLYILMFILISIISVINSTLLYQSVVGFAKTVIYTLFYFGLIQYLRYNKEKIFPLICLISVLVTFEGIIGLIQNYIGVENISTWQDKSYLNPEDVLSRVYGTLKPYNPNLLGAYIISGFSSLIGLTAIFLEKKKYKLSVLSGICLIIVLLTLFYTGCRGAYIALAAIIFSTLISSWQIVYKFFQNSKLKKYWINSLAALTGCGILFIATTPSILKRILSIFILRGDSSTSFRMNVYHSSLQMLHDNWVLGIGTGNKTFREIYGLYMLSGFDALSSYCVFLEIAVESGIFALFTYLIFLGILLKNAIKTFIEQNDYRTKIILFIAFTSVIAIMVHGFVDTIYFRPQIQFIYWFMVAIIVAIATKQNYSELL